MIELITTAPAIAAELRKLLPAEVHAHVPDLAQLLADVAAGVLAPDEAAVRLDTPEFALALHHLYGHSLSADGTALRFSGDTITVGNIDASEAVAIGRGAIAIKLGIYAAEQAYDVSGLANPYLGLAPFTYAERERFAGRARDVAQALGLLTTPGAQRTLLFVNGASGSGKSSFAQAGLVPALEQHYRERHLDVRHAILRPGAQPLAALADGLQQLGLPPDPAFTAAKPFMVGVPTSAPNEQTVGLLVIDQFEELFSTQCDATQRDALFAILASLPAFAQIRMHLIVTLRSDFLPELFERPALYDIAKQGIDLRTIAGEDLHVAIQRPLQHDYPEKRLEPDLVDTLVREAAAEAAYLPLLQVTLQKLFADGSLTLAAYERPIDQGGCGGTIAGAIRQQAEEIYNFTFDGDKQQKRTAAEQAAVMATFLDLVEVSLGDDPRRDVRRRRALAELARGDPARERLVSELATARLLSTDVERRAGRDVEVVDIIHESLIANWNRLRQAIAAQRDALQQRVRFEQALAEWQEHQQDDAYLLAGVHLAEAEALRQCGDVALQPEEARAFCDRSVRRRDEERQRRLQRTRLVAVGLGLLALVALVAAGFAVNRQQVADSQRAKAVAEQLRADAQAATAVAERQRADTQATVARTQEAIAISNEQKARREERIARARELAAAAVSKLTVDPQLSVLLATAAVSETQALGPASVPEAQEALQQAVQTSRVQRILAGHAKGVQKLVYSPDGLSLATASNDGTVRLWDLVTGQTERIFDGSSDAILGLAISPEGGQLAAAGADGIVIVWETASGAELRTIQAHDGAATSVAFSPDDKLLATAGDDGTAKIWEIASGAELRTIQAHDEMATGVTFSPDGKLLATAGADGTAKIWEVTSGTKLYSLEGHNDVVEDVVFSPDGTLLATASDDETARVWDAETGALLTTIQGHTSNVYAVAFSPDGRFLATASADGTARLWNPATGRELITLAGHEGGVSDLAFSPDGTQLATAGLAPDNTARLWSLAFVHSERPTFITFNPAGDGLVSASRDGAHIWDAATGRELPVSIAREEEIYGVAFSPDGKLLATAGDDGTAQLWDVTTGEKLRTFTGHEAPVGRVIFNPDGTLLATASDDGTARLWNIATDQTRVLTHTESGYVYGLAFSPDGTRLATASFETDPTLKLWDVAMGDELRTISGTGEFTSVAWSPDGKRLATGDEDGFARIWDADTGAEVLAMAHPLAINGVAWSPDGRHLATASRDKTVQVWDAATGQLEYRLPHPAEVYGLAFSPDSTRLATASADSVVRIFPLSLDNLLTLARQRIVHPLSAAECKSYQLAELCVPSPSSSEK